MELVGGTKEGSQLGWCLISILVCTLNTKDGHVDKLCKDFFHVFPTLTFVLGDIIGAFQMLQPYINYRNQKVHYVITIVKTIYKMILQRLFGYYLVS